MLVAGGVSSNRGNAGRGCGAAAGRRYSRSKLDEALAEVAALAHV